MPSRFNEAIREFTRTVVSPFDVDAVLHRVTDQAATHFPAVGAGILLDNERGQLEFAAASNASVTAVGHVQDKARRGAAFDAYETGRMVVVDDLNVEERWPEFTRRALKLGLNAVIAAPLRAWGKTIGALSLYCDEPTSWTSDDREACDLLAAMAAGYIINASQLRTQRELSENLRAAIESRGIIERAKGMLIAQRGIDAAAAFELLRQASMAQNVKLRDVAQALLERGPNIA